MHLLSSRNTCAKDSIANGAEYSLMTSLSSAILEEHLTHLEMFFEKLKRYNITLKASKMTIRTQELSILGHTVRHMEILPGAVNTRKLLASPQNKKQLQGFLGLTNYFRKFVGKYSHRALPLNKLLNSQT
eukprot:PhF_6_TR40202/c0_g1_i2/m.59678